VGPLNGTTARDVPAGARCDGFTLVEVLVVVLILAIAAGTAVLVLDRDERGTVVREARHLGGAIEYAAARAQMRGETIGLSAEPGGWRFWTRAQDGRFAPLDGDDALVPHSLPSPLTAGFVAYAGRALDADAIVPLRASGRNEPFSLAIASPRFRVVLASDPVNRVTITGPEAIAP
jgi:general secretion pathway protein H